MNRTNLALASASVERFDPVAVFEKISANGQGFILEGRSTEPGADRYVLVGNGDCERLLTGPGTPLGDVNPATALRAVLETMRVDDPGSDAHLPFMSGAVGYFGYESIRHFEPSVGSLPDDPLHLPEAAFFIPKNFLVYDREEHVLTAIVKGGTQQEANALLAQAAPVTFTGSTSLNASCSHITTPVPFDPDCKARHQNRVRQARIEIERGELMQVVLSHCAARRTCASAINIYRSLSGLNPSPYMFYLDFGDFAVIGSSPELMVRSRGECVVMHPIAGTRPRGATQHEDIEQETELLFSEKERAEHLMLVDLARNDLGRVSKPGTVHVDSFMATERYSHVMHLVSKVSGRLRDGADGLDAFVAGFPLGTLTGAPRLRSVELIAELETEGRGPYCGGVGWFDARGDVDTGTLIRSVLIKDGMAHVHGGGGIVFDSDPEQEYRESVQKMTAQFIAIELAERMGREPAAVETAVATG